jgi:hypothetical protein
MCYSVEASKTAFFINIISTFILYNYSEDPEYKVIALFLGYVGIVQLYDWILWENQENNINYIISKIQMLHVNLEPLVLAYLFYNLNGKLPDNSSIITLLYGCVFCIYLISKFNSFKYTPIENNRLQWQWIEDPTQILYTLYISAFVILGYENLHAPKNIVFVILSIAAVLFGIYYKNEGGGRYWCKYGAYIPLVFIPII